jgi:hypothetical protein
MSDIIEYDQAIEQFMKDAVTSYMLDCFEIEGRLKAAVHKIADELLAEKLAALREGALNASAHAEPTEHTNVVQLGSGTRTGAMYAKQR